MDELLLATIIFVVILILILFFVIWFALKWSRADEILPEKTEKYFTQQEHERNLPNHNMRGDENGGDANE